MNDNKFFSRKFLIAAMLIVGANIQAAYGNIDSSTYAVVCGIAGGFYQWANVSTKKKENTNVN